MAKRSLIIAAFFLASIASAAEVLNGEVIGISDGDSLTVLVDRKPIKVRLAEIDAPESKQPFGTRSRQSLAAICHRKPAQVTWQTRDRYKRIIGYVQCAGIDANAHQVRSGMAWVFDRYSSPDSPLYKLQDQARKAGKGLWADAHPVPPWDWRHRQKRLPFIAGGHQNQIFITLIHR